MPIDFLHIFYYNVTMYEIELKAHVQDRNAVIAALNAFADYAGSVHKHDTYYKLNAGGKKISARIRTETTDQHPQKTVLTYKRKELRTDANGTNIEVNDERECEISQADAVETLLFDIGFAVSLTKEKAVLSWNYDGALFELCTVPPLGDFLEIEILSPVNDKATVSALQAKLKSLLNKAGISNDNIEERYYSDMLREAAKSHATG